MSSNPPKVFAIDHDDYHAEHVGHLSDGRQFFLTTPFEPATDDRPGCEFVALYLFDKNGVLIDAKIDSFGPRDTVDAQALQRVYEERLGALGTVSFERIVVAPFAIERFGTQFGLVSRAPVHDGDSWAIEIQPGNYMAFFEPWDSGEYDT